MQTLEIGGATTAASDSRSSRSRTILQRAGRVLLWMGFAFGYLNGYVSKVVDQRPWLWTLSILLAGSCIIAIDRLALWLYMKYATPIFSPVRPHERKDSI